jgi:hypothetical protein
MNSRARPVRHHAHIEPMRRIGAAEEVLHE